MKRFTGVPVAAVLMLAGLVIGCSYPHSTQTSANELGRSDDATHTRVLPIANNAFAGSSINVVAGVKQTLFTSGNYQYAAFYDADAHLVLAKRALHEHDWQIQVTEYTGNVHDAHNHISLVVDADGYLHLAWDHHNSPLKYARSITPGSLQLAKAHMLSDGAESDSETSVTYPQFYRLKDGGLLFAYRDGGSGRGNLVLNRYDLHGRRWQRLHGSLIDGEGERSAYWDMSIDQRGVLHLAWIWRETPDVATNHDIAYARSLDDGETWQSLNGASYHLPITAATAHIAKRIPQHHKLMNPPVVAADDQSNPFIASYWADTPNDKPRYHVLYATPTSSAEWQEIKAPEVMENFELSGLGTKNPPISRAVLLVENQAATTAVHLIFRDDFNQGHVVAASVKDITKPHWQQRSLVQKNMGAWEPSMDIAQWQQHKRAHLLLQTVGQKDGNDAQGLQLAPTPVELLMWVP